VRVRKLVEEEVHGGDALHQCGVVLEDAAVADVEHPPHPGDLALDRLADPQVGVEPGDVVSVLVLREEARVLGRASRVLRRPALARLIAGVARGSGSLSRLAGQASESTAEPDG
jgi:hypothetical protein